MDKFVSLSGGCPNPLLAIVEKGNLSELQDFMTSYADRLDELSKLIADAATRNLSEHLAILPPVPELIDSSGTSMVLILSICSFTRTECRVLSICTDRRWAPRVFKGTESSSGFIRLSQIPDSPEALMQRIGYFAASAPALLPPPLVNKSQATFY